MFNFAIYSLSFIEFVYHTQNIELCMCGEWYSYLREQMWNML